MRHLMNNLNLTIPSEITEAATVLAENLLHSKPLTAYKSAEKQFNENDEAFGLYQKLARMQGELHARQHSGELTEEDIREMRALQQQFQSNPLVQELGEAQQGVQDFLKEINSEISGLLGVDFAALSRRCGGGGCC
jgi:cell fate (sporulation/competence/biofilm development) regulator YlbF (YheA/YmcA/DUF963 family)